ncbi:MAG: hypothetical protein GTN99_10060 [Candidatus Dadabacteria bacterium]|nr:hypothetical protein [Candidatus Dadabacteria bacterium]NIT14559.1 hypothetical protein [Candidatus Dadabacteria bacterium]
MALDLFISMKAETIQEHLYIKCNLMQMPTAQNNPFFIAEIREDEPDKLELLFKYEDLLRDKLINDDKYIIERTNYGIKIKKKVDETKDYMDEWNEWTEFSNMIYNQLKEVLEED